MEENCCHSLPSEESFFIGIGREVGTVLKLTCQIVLRSFNLVSSISTSVVGYKRALKDLSVGVALACFIYSEDFKMTCKGSEFVWVDFLEYTVPDCQQSGCWKIGINVSILFFRKNE